jgi:YVTN family beta-propeller protein
VTLGHANKLAIIDVASRKVRDYLLVGTRAWNADFTSDGKALYVVNSGSDDISIIDIENEKVKKTVPVGRYPHTIRIDD